MHAHTYAGFHSGFSFGGGGGVDCSGTFGTSMNMFSTHPLVLSTHAKSHACIFLIINSLSHAQLHSVDIDKKEQMSLQI